MFLKFIQKLWYVQHVGLTLKKSPLIAAKVESSVKFFNIEGKKHRHVTVVKILIFNFGDLWNIDVYLSVSFSVVDIIKSNE